jgi:hypothetical protein
MGVSNNMAVPMDHTPSTSHCWCHNYSLASGGLPASLSYRLAPYRGAPTNYHFRCCMNLLEKLGSSDWDPETGFAHSAYPSPPSTSSNSKWSVPLPCLHADHHHNPSQELSRPSSKPFGGMLDSPIIMRHDSLGCHMPLSPPPTLPTKTQALPLEDDISLPSIPELDDSESLLLLHTLLLPRDEEPLSLISPEWATNGIPLIISPLPEHSFLLYRSCCNNFDYLLGYPMPASSSSS